MPTSFPTATAAAVLPASMQDANATVGERACAPVTGVGGVRREQISQAEDRYLQDLGAAEAIGGCFFDAMGLAQAKRKKD